MVIEEVTKWQQLQACGWQGPVPRAGSVRLRLSPSREPERTERPRTRRLLHLQAETSKKRRGNQNCRESRSLHRLSCLFYCSKKSGWKGGRERNVCGAETIRTRLRVPQNTNVAAWHSRVAGVCGGGSHFSSPTACAGVGRGHSGEGLRPPTRGQAPSLARAPHAGPSPPAVCAFVGA